MQVNGLYFVINNNNLLGNRFERDLVNILIDEYNYIKGNPSIKNIIVQKYFYVDVIENVESFVFTREEFLNLELRKGKTKKHFRVKLNKIDTEKRDSITLDLMLREVGLVS